jgi:antitoxin VapB
MARTRLATADKRWYIPFDMTVAKVFKNGRSQAIRLPKQFRVRTQEVFLKKTPEGFLVVERDPWEIFEEGCQELSSDFMAERVQPAAEKRGWSK